METAGSILISGIIDGENGTNGYNTAVVQLFRRYTPTQAAPTPALPNGALTYTFSTGKLAGSYFNGWSQDMPSAASGGKLFVTMATARSQEATDSIAANEWSTPVEYVSDGTNGEPGISQAPVIIYKRSATQPTDKPADGAKYYFKAVGSTKAGSLVGTLNGWSTAIPANTNGLPCWTRQATAVAPATADYDEIAASEWSDPATKLVEDGAEGVTYALVPSVSSVVKKKDGSYSVSVVSCTRQKNVGGTITNNTTDGTITCRIDGGNEVSYTNNDEIPVSIFAKSVQFIFKVDDVTVDTKTVLMIVDGKDNVEYKISLAGSVLAHDPNTGKLIVSIKGRVYKVEGDTTTPYTDLTKEDLYLYFEDAVGDEDDVPKDKFNVSGNGFTTTYHNGDNYSGELFFGAQLWLGGKVVARESIQVVKYGTNGQSITGHTGRFFYYAGDYSGTPADYAMQETQGPYAKVTNGTTVEFWMLDFKGVEPASFPARATEAPSDQSTQWTKMSSQQQYYIARAFFGPYAHFGSFIINGDWMISQFGVLYDAIGGAHAIDSDTASWNRYNKDNAYTKFLPDYPNSSQHGAINFCPNFAVDGKTGKTYQNDAYIRGEVHATSGEFSGTIKAGNTTIEGNLDLTDTDNGLTVYDQDSVPRINLQPKHINDVATLANDTYIYYALSKTQSGASSFNVTTDEQSFTLAKYENLDIDKFSVVLRSIGSSGTIYPSSNNTSLTIIITHPDGSTTTKDITTTKFDSGRYRNLTDKIRFAASVAGTYRVKIAVRNSSSWTTGQTTVYAFVNARYQTSKDTQVYIAKDGFYAHAGANKLFWAGETETQIRYGFNGIRWNDADIFGNEAMDVVADVKGEVPNAKPLWLPFYNYVPVFSLGVGTMLFTSQVIGNIGETKYGFLIDAYRNRGVCIVKRGYEDNSGNEQPSWVILPPPTFTDSDGDSVSLPYGYQITIINSTGTDIFVVPYSNSVHGAVIIDANRNNNWFAEINGVQSRDTYIYVAHNTWLSMHDTQ